MLGWRAQEEQCHYAAAKAGVMALTRCSAMEAAEFGIRINAVSPSIAMHDFLRKTSTPELLESLASREAFGRAAEVWEVANVMMFLASDYSSYRSNAWSVGTGLSGGVCLLLSNLDRNRKFFLLLSFFNKF